MEFRAESLPEGLAKLVALSQAVPEKKDAVGSEAWDDRGVVHVETIGYNQDGTVVCIFRRKVMVPTRAYGDARGGEQPGRPVPKG